MTINASMIPTSRSRAGANSVGAENPESETGHRLAERRQKLLKLFTGGDPGITANLQKLYADKANWPETFKKPYSDAVDKFLCDAAKGSEKAIVK